MTPIQLREARQMLAGGAVLRFVWRTVRRSLILPDGQERLLDGRCYRSIINDPRYERAETGSVDARDLVIEWRLPSPHPGHSAPSTSRP